jgi:hypothetical protein
MAVRASPMHCDRQKVVVRDSYQIEARRTECGFGADGIPGFYALPSLIASASVARPKVPEQPWVRQHSKSDAVTKLCVISGSRSISEFAREGLESTGVTHAARHGRVT